MAQSGYNAHGSETPCCCSLEHVCVLPEARASMPKEAELAAMEKLFSLVGDATRMRLLMALSQRAMCVSDLCALLGMDKSAISHQLARLREAGLVSAQKDGRLAYYYASDGHVVRLMELGLEHARKQGCELDSAHAAQKVVR